MRLIDFFKDKIITLVICLLMSLVSSFIMFVFDVNKSIIMYLFILQILAYLALLYYNYYREKNFYNKLTKSIEKLDKKYLVTEILDEPDFIEGKILYGYLYEINKSMLDNINKYKYICEDFKDYIETWCHEIKTPLATSKMIIENNKNEVNKSLDEELTKMSNYIEQVLYYVRSENVEKDYIIQDVSLKTIVNEVIKKNKKDLIMKKIKVDIEDIDVNINSDQKWLEFIINQIISNSIKYSKTKDAYIKIYTQTNKNNIELFIEDNGIGIEQSDISRVFQKGFTGINGRKKYNSTGLGLYICDKLCKQLEHGISIESVINKYTKVKLTFPKSSLINDIK